VAVVGKAVVSTRIDVKGLPVQHGDHLIIANQPADFAAAITKLLADAEQRKRIERNARSVVEAHFGWAKVAEAFAGLCRQTVAARIEDKMASVGSGNVQPLQSSVYESFVSGQ
jgi:glycosyltransferase involved in cell wall biosynthesis